VDRVRRRAAGGLHQRGHRPLRRRRALPEAAVSIPAVPDRLPSETGYTD